MSKSKETLRRLAEESQTATQKAVDVLTAAKEEVTERVKKLREEVGMPPKRRNSHSDLPAVAR